ncbi:putative UbiC transcription regulator-associated [Vibrio nigripulchritudo SO65]|uniref:UTRA domain-containing protein n=1 Tax=Vibrio nigripulchritudo TaxID=28173 RepID=UPI0003B1BE4A|nr:UTRA domain-containing protein [Vibrio nigripulchritudo]CCN37911.1 putative UbiC transcription regulator-associated [Vibrio nigripulchritudo AM115]CCN41271.1 putative UbiC transcription regulator-associated [Vibrio nigripulchritudo FTn2]CCN64333.1 putative UbiC transcription regulator-associated [Vibrio nigripulchritudo POn4]CCN76904.1 putative UbiC transcription regulator-associated [Vibrio nigripulchritudo SO65]
MQYVDIKTVIEEQIESGLLPAGQKLPPERKLAESFNTTRVTLREALSLLETEGKIFREDRRGWFISPSAMRYDPGKDFSFTALAKANERNPRTEVLKAKTVLATKYASQILDLQPFSDVHQIERLRFLDERPVVYVTHYVQPDFAPTLLDHDLTQSLSGICSSEFGVHPASTQIRLRTTSLLGEIAQALRATPGAPSMVIERTCMDATGAIIDCRVEYWRHDAISIESTVELKT